MILSDRAVLQGKHSSSHNSVFNKRLEFIYFNSKPRLAVKLSFF